MTFGPLTPTPRRDSYLSPYEIATVIDITKYNVQSSFPHLENGSADPHRVNLTYKGSGLGDAFLITYGIFRCLYSVGILAHKVGWVAWQSSYQRLPRGEPHGRGVSAALEQQAP